MLVVRAVLLGLLISFAGTFPYSVLYLLNTRVLIGVPWAVLPAAVYLWLLWRYLGGRGRPESTALQRRLNLRANPLPTKLWVLSLAAGLAGFAALLALLTVMARLITMPPESQPLLFPAEMSFATAGLLIVMISITAGVVEEAAYRGYLQGMIEREHGLLIAILANGAAFGLAHIGHHPSYVVAMLPYYVAVAAVYGGLTCAADSILPAVVLHASGNVVSLGRLWLTGLPEWQLSATPPGLVWSTGLDGPFIGAVVAVFVLGSVTAGACVYIARLRRLLQARRASGTGVITPATPAGSLSEPA